MAQSLAALNVRLTIEAEDFQRRLDAANNRIAGFQRQTNNSLGQAGRHWGRLEQSQNRAVNGMREGIKRLAVGLAALASVNALKGMITNAIDAANAADDFSVRIGITVEELSKLEFAAASSGIAISAFRTSMQRMVRRSSEASEGIGVAVKAFDSLNLSAKDLAKLEPDQQLRAIAKAMRGVSDQGERLKIAVQIFDTEGAAMLQMVDGLESMRDEAEQLGLVLSTDLAKSATSFNAQIVKLDFLWDAVARTVALKLLPALNDAMEAAARFVGWLNKKIDTTQSVEALTELRDLYQEKIAWATAIEKVTGLTYLWGRRVDELNEKIRKTVELREALAIPVGNSGISEVGDYEYIAPKPTKPETGKDTSAADAKALDRARARADAEFQRKDAAGQAALDQLLGQLQGEEYAIQASHERRVELAKLAYEQTKISQDRQNKLILDSEKKAGKERKALAEAEVLAKLSLGAQLAGNIASIAQGESGRLIEIQRAAGIVQATIAGAAGMTKAYNDPGGYAGLALAASIAGMTAVNIATIAGARASGGPVSAGKTYLVGERGPELFTAQTSGSITSNSAMGGSNINVNIIEDASKSGQVELQGSDVSVFVASAVSATMDTLHSEFNSGRGLFASMEQKYGLAR